jgi:superfamily II DNA/RNA helicase
MDEERWSASSCRCQVSRGFSPSLPSLPNHPSLGLPDAPHSALSLDDCSSYQPACHLSSRFARPPDGSLTERDSAVSTISQSLLYTASEPGKILALRNLLSTGGLPYPSLIFTQSIERADELYEVLALEGLRVECVHGGKGKGKRDEAIKGFREGKVWVLVVTEVLARGMDFRGVKVVVNYGKSGNV